MNREQVGMLIQQAAMNGDNVNINFKAHAAKILRALADEIESGHKEVGFAELRLDQDNKPFATYVVSVKEV